MIPTVIEAAYLAAALAFIIGLKGLSHPRTARRGNALSAAGMLLAVVVTLCDQRIVTWEVIIAGLAAGGIVGAWVALRTPLTDMPQVVAVFNGFGGGASALAVGAVLEESVHTAALTPMLLHEEVAAAASGLIGGIAFTGSGVAFAKLQGWMRDQPILVPGRHLWNFLCLAGCAALAAWALGAGPPAGTLPFWGLVGAAGVLGLGLVLPIGGADMPVVISLLNACSGLAAAAVGWVLGNSVLLIAGSLVGAAGFLLTALMCRAMNRSLANVMFAGVGAAVSSGDDALYAGRVKRTSAAEVASLLAAARRVVVVPGFGLAVAQAQHAVRNLTRALDQRGTQVDYAVHPVAGRMPGHLNVLLAEADIPYDLLRDRDEINDSWADVDVVLVIGANDVVNPAARDDRPDNPLGGMPILDVDRARSIVVIKRSLNPGFAGVPNPLFCADHCLMLFADAKEAVTAINRELESE